MRGGRGATNLDAVELRAERGRAVLVGAPELFEPPTALVGALDEWAEVAAAVCAHDETDPATAELVSARGRQLAARLAAVAGTAVGYSDPVRGVLEHVPANASPAAASAPAPASVPVPTSAPVPAPAPVPASKPAPASGSSRAAVPPHATAEPTPWATGLTASAFAAAVVLVAVVTLVRGLGEVAWWLGALSLVVVTAGLAPSVWLARQAPLWRWLSYGVATGLALSWVSILLATLGS